MRTNAILGLGLSLAILNLTSGEKILLNTPEETTIDVMQGKSWTFPAVPENKLVTIEFEHRIDYPKLGGWNACFQINVNGKLISAYASRKNPRLLNKPYRFPHKDYRFFNCCDGYKWYSMYSPDYEQGKDRYQPVNAEAYRLVLDVTDLLHSDKTNQFELRFGGSYLPALYKNMQIQIKPALKVRQLKVVQGTQTSPIHKKTDTVFVTMKTVPPADYSLDRNPEKLVLRMGTVSIPVFSSFSVPGKKEPVRLEGKDSLKTPSYSVSRKLIQRKNRIDVFDTFESQAAELIGIRIQYDTDSTPFDDIRLSGDPSPERTLGKGGQNPSVFLGSPSKNIGIGFVAVDDVFRVQNQQFLENGRAGIRSESFALSPGEKRTVEWSIYPVRSADYFDFINEVRRDWSVNFPVEGGFAFTILPRYTRTKEAMEKLNRELGLKYNATGCFVWRWNGGEFSKYTHCLHGSALLDEFHRGCKTPGNPVGPVASAPMLEMLRNAAKKVKSQLSGGEKALCYVHTQLSTEIDDWKKYPDSIITRPDGTPWVYGDKSSLLHIMLPTPDNAFGKRTMNYLKYVVDGLGFDGIYHDEFNYSGPRITYAQWDKVSAELDADNRVKRKIGFVPLLKLPFNLQVLEYFVAQRKIPFVANFSPETRSEMKFHFPRFEETFHNYMPLASHLFTPIQLGDMLAFPMTKEGMLEDIRHALKNGLLYYYYINTKAHPVVTRLMFPFTPIELHSGWLLGKERILTIHSGEYGWKNENALCVPYVCNESGETVTTPEAVFLQTPDGLRCRLRLKKDHCAVLVRIPFTAELTGKATLENVSYSDGVFSCVMNGSGTAGISDGKSIHRYQINGQKLPIRIETKR